MHACTCNKKPLSGEHKLEKSSSLSVAMHSSTTHVNTTNVVLKSLTDFELRTFACLLLLLALLLLDRLAEMLLIQLVHRTGLKQKQPGSTF